MNPFGNLPRCPRLLIVFLWALFLVACTGDQQTFTAPPNQQNNGFNFVVQPGNGVVAGRVLDGTGTPVAQATVQFNGVAPRDDQAREIRQEVTTNSEGYYQFQVEPGTGTIRVLSGDVTHYDNIPVTIEPDALTQINLPGGTNGWLYFRQLSFRLDGATTDSTAWGQVRVCLPNPDALQVMYFNLQVGDNWAVQNLPLQALDLQPNSFFDIFVNFDLGVTPGQAITQIMALPSLSAQPISSLPTVLLDVPVAPDTLTFNSGLLNFPASLYPPPGLFAGGNSILLATLANFDRKDFNQDVGLNECVPGACSNSLKFLNANSTVDISPVTSIDEMKKATGWADGCGVGWAQLKNDYMTNGNHPITTENTESFETAMEAIKAGKDVELTGGWHAAMVVGITKLDNGNWSVQVAHDTKQGEAGGTKVETL
ncbi:MAG: carboxypeptidase-like regulatory domain-containing protein, partial [Candidatus Eremiobacterota bacterium]